MKVCTKCSKEKELIEFYKNKAYKDGYISQCKKCMNAASKCHYNNNKVKMVAYKSLYYQEHKDEIGEYYRDNKDKIQNQQAKYYRENKDKIISQKLKYRNSNINCKLSHILRSRLNKAIKNNQKTGSAISDLGCSVEELKKHLESKFQEGMTWDNYGEWHIDHIKPLANFDLTNEEELKKACHYTNMQPLWAKENLSWGSKDKSTF